MARLPFTSIFKINPDGSIEPLIRIRVGGVTLGPGTQLSKGLLVGGIDLTQFTSRELETQAMDGIIVITAIY